MSVTYLYYIDDACRDILYVRLSPDSHHLEYINDGDINSFWVSSFLEDVIVSIDLQDRFQVCVPKTNCSRQFEFPAIKFCIMFYSVRVVIHPD